MKNRIFPIIVLIICIAWSVFVSIDILSSESSVDFKNYFNESDQKVLVVHQSSEVDWNSENFQILPSNQTIALSILANLNNKASLYISAKRPFFLIEKKENWNKQSIEKILKNGLYNFEFTGRKTFKFGNFKGQFSKNQILLYIGELEEINSSKSFPIVDFKSSYSLVDFSNSEFDVVDVYQKNSKTILYKKKKVKLKNCKNLEDKMLFSSLIPTNFTNYTFYQSHYLISSDAVFAKSNAEKWIKNGIVFLSNGTAEVAIFDFMEGQNPVQNFNEQFKLPENNESFGVYDAFPIFSRWTDKTLLKYYVFEKDGLCLIAADKQYLDEVLTEMSLGKTLSQNVEKSNSIFGSLPSKVVYREVNPSVNKTHSVFGNQLVETLIVAKEQVDAVKQTSAKDYFAMNPGEQILDFVTFNGRGNVLVLTASNKLIAYSNGAKRWEKTFNETPSVFSLFSFRNNTIALCFSNETQIMDLNGKLIYRFNSSSSVIPSLLTFENKELFFIGDGNSDVSVLNTAGKLLKKLHVNGTVKKILSFYKDKKIYSAIVTNESLYITEIAKKGKSKIVAIDSMTQVFATDNNLFIANTINGQLTIQQADGTISTIKIKRDAQLMNIFSENGKPYFLLKTDKKLAAMDVNGYKSWERNLTLEEISRVQVAVNQNGKIIIGILDTIENRLYLYDSKGNRIDESERHGELKLEISPFGTSAFSITTFLGSYLIQYTKL